jgi:hypothetical protein
LYKPIECRWHVPSKRTAGEKSLLCAGEGKVGDTLTSLNENIRDTNQGLNERVKPRVGMPVVLAHGMGSSEYLMRGLAERVDNADGSEAFDRIVNLIKILCTAVRQMMEAIRSFNGCFAALLETKHQIDPLV